jgi:DASH complex subunit DAD2
MTKVEVILVPLVDDSSHVLKAPSRKEGREDASSYLICLSDHIPMSSSQSTSNLSTAHQILLQKQQEHAGLQALRESSAALLQRVEQLAEMSNIMADGGEGMFGLLSVSERDEKAKELAVGAVLRNWPHVFSILNMFGELRYCDGIGGGEANSAEPPQPPPSDPNDPQPAEEEPQEPLPQLVRLPYNSDSPATAQS